MRKKKSEQISRDDYKLFADDINFPRRLFPSFFSARSDFPSQGTHFDFVTLVIAKLLARVRRLDTFPFHSGGGKVTKGGK